MCSIKFLIQFSVFLLCLKVSFEQDLTSREKRILLGELKHSAGEAVTDDPYDAEDKTNPTDLSEILNIDSGQYTTQGFDYHNLQNTYATVNYVKETNDTCINSYIACLLTASTRTPVCVTNDFANRHYTYTLISYCDMYFDNCRRGYRVWRAIAPGICFWKDTGEKRVYEFPSDRLVEG